MGFGPGPGQEPRLQSSAMIQRSPWSRYKGAANWERKYSRDDRYENAFRNITCDHGINDLMKNTVKGFVLVGFGR